MTDPIQKLVENICNKITKLSYYTAHEELDNLVAQVEASVKETAKFKECWECAKKAGSPILCPQCLWVRERWDTPASPKIALFGMTKEETDAGHVRKQWEWIFKTKDKINELVRALNKLQR